MAELNDIDSLQVLFEDNHLLVVYKPCDLLTQPSGSDRPSLESICKEWIKRKYHKPGNIFLHAIHRLDKPVAGIVLFAKTSKALQRLNASIRAKETTKIYRAEVEGVLPALRGTLEDYIVHGAHQAFLSAKENPDAKKALLQYTVLKAGPHTSQIEIELVTGRYHQIRLQLSAAGCPILGDVKYGSKLAYSRQGIALEHCRLSIPHPITGKQAIFEC